MCRPGQELASDTQPRERRWAPIRAIGDLTATVIATAATNGKRQPPTAHNTRAIRADWGCIRPEKTVEDQRQGGVAVANTVAKPLDKARPMRTAVEYRPSAATATGGPG